jgi:hypothetical protein
MGKKCIPGVLCIENMTLFILLVILLVLVYLSYRISDLGLGIKNENKNNSFERRRSSSNSIILSQPPILADIVTKKEDPLTDAYVPPMRDDTIYLAKRSIYDVRGDENSYGRKVVVGPGPSVASQPFDPQYRQIGILTRKTNGGNNNNEILPLMGRRQLTSRDKWQYYTIAGGGNGNLQTKLPVSLNGKSCTSEYGCNEIYNNDTVYVEGIKDIFVATVYENNTFTYSPF